MKFLPAVALFAAAAAPALSAAPVSWTIDPNHSAAQFAVRHLMVSTVRGEFSGVKGTIVLDEQDPSRSSIDATIDATTINTRVVARDNDLKGASFFDVAKYPTITFKSSKIRGTGPSTFVVEGDLTMHGVTRAVTLQVEAAAAVKDPKGNERRGAEATTKVSRKDFGVNGTPTMVGDEVQITLDIEAVHRAEAPPPSAT